MSPIQEHKGGVLGLRKAPKNIFFLHKETFPINYHLTTQKLPNNEVWICLFRLPPPILKWYFLHVLEKSAAENVLISWLFIQSPPDSCAVKMIQHKHDKQPLLTLCRRVEQRFQQLNNELSGLMTSFRSSHRLFRGCTSSEPVLLVLSSDSKTSLCKESPLEWKFNTCRRQLSGHVAVLSAAGVLICHEWDPEHCGVS